MARPERSVTALIVFLVYILALFGSYCQMAPVMTGASRGWNVGTGVKYKLTTTLLFSEATPSKTSNDVGFRLTGELNVAPIWKDPNEYNSFLLEVELSKPQLWIKSRRAPEPEGFVEHSSELKSIPADPFVILWQNGKILSFYASAYEGVSSYNLKRGLASLFQYSTLDENVKEVDASGVCNVTYHSLGPHTIGKRVISCERDDLPKEKGHLNPIFGAKVTSLRSATYELTQHLIPSSIREEERHEMTLIAKPEVGTVVISERLLEMLPDAPTVRIIEAETMMRALQEVYPNYQSMNLELVFQPFSCPDSGCPTIEETIDQYRSALNDNALGTVKSASAFLKLLPLVKSASSENLVKILKNPRYRQLKTQLLDVFGSVSTLAAHQAAMKILQHDEVGDDTERYLWALSVSPAPNADVFKDILKRSEETIQNGKVSETLALTAAAMARHMGSPVAVEKARVSLELGLDSCTGEECKVKFLRALRNLKSKASIPTLLKFAMDENRAVSIAAWRALATLPKKVLTDEVINAAIRVFYQIGPKRDSTARTFALDIILGTKPSKEDIRSLVKYLAGRDSAYEIRKYLSQRLGQVSEKDPEFARVLNEIFQEFSTDVVNYNVMAQKGLSTAFTRSFLKSPMSNGSLVTIQEVNSGLLKRGTVDIVLQVENNEESVFSLGLFAGGLSSFISSSEDEEQVDVEPATAGMDIDFMGVGIRPFVFFSGQSELMGHIWSGTASERTPAFQALASIHNEKEYIPLRSGVIAELDIQGAVSFDLAGQIEFSLWSRKAQSLVDLKAGIVLQGGTRVRTDIVQSTVEFSMTMEPKLELATDVTYSGPVSLCMRLSQPETIVKHQIYKIERIAKSRHKLRKTRRISLYSPGKSYLLNQKNNEMCSKVFS